MVTQQQGETVNTNVIISLMNLNVMLMAHLLSAVFKGVVMLSQGSIHFRQETINLISYVRKGGGYRAMSECSKYQLLLKTEREDDLGRV
jgi:hypothetical protein